jgi:hypothetical protein
MIKIPVSSKISTAPWPRPGVPDYIFAVRSSGGQSLGIDLEEFDWRLEVDSHRGLVSVEYFRSDADIPGTPIGLFRYAIGDNQLSEFESLASGAKLGELHPAMKGHPGYTERLYTYVHAGRTIRVTINNSDEETNAAIAPLRNRINAMLSTSFQHPERAVRLGLERRGAGFEASIENIGIEKVCFSDPKWIAAAGVLHRSVIETAEFDYKPGDPPPMLNWQSVALDHASEHSGHEPLVVLESHGVWKTGIPWKRPNGKRYLAFFTWANYQGQPAVDHVYRIRGRADSDRLVVEP